MTAPDDDRPDAVRLRPPSGDDLAWLEALNTACVPAVNALDRQALEALLARAAWARLAEVEGAPSAVLVAFAKGSTYESTNYAWFDAQAEPFLYIDRVMVADAARRYGLGRRLYAALEDWARAQGLPRLCCEVNEDPPNPQSQAFHRSLGFRHLVSRINPADGKRVSMLEKRLEPGRWSGSGPAGDSGAGEAAPNPSNESGAGPARQGATLTPRSCAVIPRSTAGRAASRSAQARMLGNSPSSSIVALRLTTTG